MPSGARANDQYQYKLSMAEQIEELRKKRELLGMFLVYKKKIPLKSNVFGF
jgi:hypothetical protein